MDIWEKLETKEGREEIAKQMCLPMRWLPWTSDLVNYLNGKCAKCGINLFEKDDVLCKSCNERNKIC